MTLLDTGIIVVFAALGGALVGVAVVFVTSGLFMDIVRHGWRNNR